MQITLPDDPTLNARATAGGFSSIDEYVLDLLNKDAERDAIQQGIDAMNVGKTRPFDEFDAEFRSNH
jgi:hypothetical protein